jgi:SAM-dependent methyltransferase
MQDVNCYNCGASRNTFYAAENGFNLVKCSECGLLFVKPRPDDNEITQAHKTGVHRGAEEISVTGIFRYDKIRDYLKTLDDLIEDHSAMDGKDWLDIGCGYGEFLLALQKFTDGKIILRGMEPNIHKKKAAVKKGLDVSSFDLDAHTYQYDVISLLNVYSHLPDPATFIFSCKRLLKPGGELFLETGDTANLSSRDHSRPFDLPDHLSFASEGIVVSILERSGFEIIKIMKYPCLKLNLTFFAKEIVKVFLPNKKPRFKMLFQRKSYAKTDMFIRAKLKN